MKKVAVVVLSLSVLAGCASASAKEQHDKHFLI
jgi:uncharacterized protein YcfL